MDARRLANLVHYWLMSHLSEQDRRRVESELEAPLGPDDNQPDDFDRAMAGMAFG